jgi:hypothetical protein
MATSPLAKQVQELRRLIDARNATSSSLVYLREGAELPDGIDADRVVWIKRVLIDPPEQAEEALPEIVEASPAIERAAPPSFRRRLAEPKLGIV